jgi:hypothetical protein
MQRIGAVLDILLREEMSRPNCRSRMNDRCASGGWDATLVGQWRQVAPYVVTTSL